MSHQQVLQCTARDRDALLIPAETGMQVKIPESFWSSAKNANKRFVLITITDLDMIHEFRGLKEPVPAYKFTTPEA